MEPRISLRELRRSRGLSQEALARRAKVSVRTIFSLEHGSTPGLPSTRRRLMEALGLPYSEHEAVFGPRRKGEA